MQTDEQLCLIEENVLVNAWVSYLFLNFGRLCEALHNILVFHGEFDRKQMEWAKAFALLFIAFTKHISQFLIVIIMPQVALL